LWFVLNIGDKQWGMIIGCGYVLASLWLSANAASAFYSFNAPAPQLQAVLPSPVAGTFIPSIAPDPTLSLEDVAVLRDPFSNSAVPDARHSSNKVSMDPSGLRLQGIILSRKNGIVLEEARSGAVYFLSEGEQANGILVKSITKTSACVDVGGNLFDLFISGEKK
jgi:type II secretory pathway component PulC